jgi:hypothetical protein
MRTLALCFVLALSACGKPPEPKPTEGPVGDPVPTAAPSASPAASEMPAPAEDAAPPPAAASPFAEPMVQKNPSDFAWLTHLVATLSDKPASREHVIAFLGQDGGADSSSAGKRRVTPRSQYLTNVSVYPLAHVKIEVAVDMEFAKDQPSRSVLQSALGPLQSMPKKPDAVGSGPSFAYYKKGAHGTVRVFIEFDPKNDQKAVKLHVDVDGVAQ